MENRASKFLSATTDTINSEFYHEIYFRGKEAPLPGASGRVGYKEKKGSQANFLNYCLRLMKSRYYAGSDRDIEGIFFYFNQSKELIVRMYPQRVEWESKYVSDTTWHTVRFKIDSMYKLLQSQWPLEKIQDHLMIKRVAKEFFNPHDLSDKGFTAAGLADYCNRLKSIGYASGEIDYYELMYFNRYFLPRFYANDLSKLHETEQQLADFCNFLIKCGVPYVDVELYFKTYKERYFNK
jgi:hypothetical protein